MKRQFSFSAIMMTCMVMVAVFLSSCESKSDHVRAIIPSDAPVVMEINIEKLTLKSNVANYKDQLADMIVAADENDRTALKIADALRKMDDGGLNFHKPVYLFTTADIEGLFITASVRSKDAVNATVLDLGDGKFRLVEEDGLTWIETEGHETIGVFNSEYFLLGTSEEKELYEKLITEDGGFFDTSMGQAMSSNAGDITLMLNAQAVKKDKMKLLRTLLIQKLGKEGAVLENDEVWGALCKTQLVTNLKFSVGEISLNIHNAGEKAPQGAFTKVSGDVFDNIPSRGLFGMLAMGINGEELSKILDAKVAESGADMDNETRMVVMMLSAYIKAMNGTAAFSVSLEGLSSDPGIVALLPIAKERSQYLFNMISKELDKPLYLTGDNAYTAVSNMRAYEYGYVHPSVDLASHAKGCYAYGYFDIGKLLMMAMEDNSIKYENPAYYQTLLDFVEQLGYAEIKVTSFDDMSIIMKLQDNEHNSLSVLLTRSFDLGLQYLQYREAQSYDYYDDYDDDYVYLDYLGESDMYPDSLWTPVDEVEW